MQGQVGNLLHNLFIENFLEIYGCHVGSYQGVYMLEPLPSRVVDKNRIVINSRTCQNVVFTSVLAILLWHKTCQNYQVYTKVLKKIYFS
jgi:hypothetical protein